jgi:circadian clock protein KaiB
MEKYVLKLFISGKTNNSQKAIENLEKVCKKALDSNYELTIIDVFEEPDLAEKMNILATPTVIKEQPDPVRRVIGDLSDSDKVSNVLDL